MAEVADSERERSAHERANDEGTPVEPLLSAETMVDHFKVIRPIGQGGMGAVFLARDTKLGRRVALKIVRSRLAGSDRAIARFQKEAETTARFSHPNIVTIHAVGEHRGMPYLALEYVPGQSLSERIDEGLPTLREALRIATSITDGVLEAHRHGVLHRDLKPANVLIGRDGRVRVLDFGLAKIAQSEGGPEVRAGEPLDAFRQVDRTHVAGTPRYMAPEQWRAEPSSEATDVWALGMTLFKLLAGRLPYSNAALWELGQEVCNELPVPSVARYVELPARLAKLIDRCLEKDPPDRPALADVARELRELSQERPQRGGDESPFRGLLPFTEQHADLFYGRDEEIAQFLERTRLEPVLPVVGPSGAGKSSFVRAGVLPRLRESGARVIVMRPGSDPFRQLAARLLRLEHADATVSTVAAAVVESETRDSPLGYLEEPVREISTDAPSGPIAPVRRDLASAGDTPWSADEQSSIVPSHEVDETAQKLLERPEALSLRLRAIAARRKVRVVLFVDQFEEVFTLVSDENVRSRFVDAVCTAADDPSDPVRIVFTLRDDFLGRMAAGARVREVLSKVTVLQQPGPGALRDILRQPVRAAGYCYEDDDMVDAMVREVMGEAAGLPLLQFAAQTLWTLRDQDRKVLLRSSYELIGGVAGALARHADGVLDGLTPQQAGIARQLLLRLVTAERTRKVVPRAKALAGLAAEADDVLAGLTGARLVSVRKRRTAGDGDATLELVHESLIDHWEVLSQWIDESKEQLVFLREAEAAAERWRKRGRRDEDLWQEHALAEANMIVRRRPGDIPDLIDEFLVAARERERRLRARKRAVVVGVLVGLSIVALVLALQKREADRQRDRAELQQAAAERQRHETELQRAAALREGARAAFAQGNVLEARAKTRLAFEIEDSESGRALWWQLAADPLLWRSQQAAIVYDVALSPDGKRAAAANQDGSIYLLDTETRALLRVLRGHRDQVFTVTFSSTGLLASGSWDGEVRIWDAVSGEQQAVLDKHAGAVHALAFSPDGRTLASASADKRMQLWRNDAGQWVRSKHVLEHPRAVHCVGFSPDGRLLMSGSADKQLRIWRIGAAGVTDEAPRSLSGHERGVFACTFSPDGKTIASGSFDRSVRSWDVSSGAEVHRMQGHSAAVYDLAFRPDGQRLASASWDHTVRIWDPRTGQAQRTLRGHTAQVYGVSFSPDGRRLASSSWDKTVRYWDLDVRAEATPRVGHESGVYAVGFTPDASVVVSGGSDGSVRLWDAKSGDELRAIEGHSGAVHAVVVSQDGRTLASASKDKSIRLYQLDGGDVSAPQVLTGHTSTVHDLSFSPDGKVLASGGSDGLIKLWDVANKRATKTLEGHTATVETLAFSPDGATIASGSWDRTIRLWDVASGDTKQQWGEEAIVYGVAWSPDSQQLVRGAWDKTVTRYDVETGQATPVGTHDGRVYKVAFHRDGKHVASSSSDGTARVWGDDEPLVLRGHNAEVNALSYSPLGDLLATAGDDGTVRLWDPAAGRPRWLAPLLLTRRRTSPIVRGVPAAAERMWLLSHRGWTTLDGQRDDASPPVGADLAQALEHHARRAARAAHHMCVDRYDGKLTVWNIEQDKRVASFPLEQVSDLLATDASCVALANGKIYPFAHDDEALRPLDLAKAVSAIAWSEDHLLVAAGDAIVTFAASEGSLQRVDERPAGVGITALTGAGDTLAVGYGDGSIELLRRDQDDGVLQPEGGAQSFPFEGVPSSPVLQLRSGPMGTLVAGFANGVVGLWSPTSGERLASARLHGPVVHMALHDGKLYAATSLGFPLVWNFGDLTRGYCHLLADIRRRVPVVWRDGHPVVQPATPHPACP